jgi:hypothetical protein
VPSGVWSPVDVIKGIAHSFNEIKKRMKIFDESMDSRGNGGTRMYLLTNKEKCLG